MRENMAPAMEDVASRSTEHGPEDYGKNVHMTLTFMRHEEPGKTPDGMSADYLTETGKLNAAVRGFNLDAGIKKLFSSPKKRAKQTVDIMGQNAYSDVEIMNKTFEQAETERPEGEKENKFNVREVPELDTAPNIGPLWKEAAAHAKELIKGGDKHREIDLTLQYILEHPDRAKELGAPSTEEIAAPLAYRVAYEAQMSDKLLNNSDVELIHGTHGPKLEPFIREVIVNKAGEPGFKHVDEIGGAFDPGEGFGIELRRNDKDSPDNPNNYELELKVRGMSFKVDVTRLLEPAKKYLASRGEKAK